MNDDINKLIREKFHYNKRIYELGGLDYNTIERQRRIEEGDDQINSMYRYFGAAKNLPGVKELLLQQQQNNMKGKKRKFTDIHQRITPEYFGWNDEEDGALLELENDALKNALSKINHSSTPSGSYNITENNNTKHAYENQPTHQGNIFRSIAALDNWNNYYQLHSTDDMNIASDEQIHTNEHDVTSVDFFHNVPTQDDIAKILLERRKKDLLQKYLL
jgi:pre-mRNA-splicing factor ISY1